ncbi:MAG: TlpA family protein disulfide reductase [Marinifilaceae bacterium]|jgi:hypothetical protein
MKSSTKKARFIICSFVLFAFSFNSGAAAEGAMKSERGDRSTSITILEDVNSLKQIIDRFRGRIVYVDIWATFYQPCLEQFKFNAELAPFFKENRIISLYISMDGQKQKEKWKEVIQKYQLHGYHVSMGINADIGKDIVKLFTDEDGRMELAIPRYMIVNRKGEVVVRKAYSPSEGSKLIEQISQFLK